MSNMLKITVYTFVLMLALTVGAFAQATPYTPPNGKANAQVTPTPAANTQGATFIIGNKAGTVELTLDKQTIKANLPAGFNTGAASGGGALPADAVERALADAAKRGASAGSTAGTKAAEDYVQQHVQVKLNDHEKILKGDGTPENPGLVNKVGAIEAQLNGDGTSANPGMAKLFNAIKTVVNENAADIATLKTSNIILWIVVICLIIAVVILFKRRSNSTSNEDPSPKLQNKQAGGSNAGSSRNPLSIAPQDDAQQNANQQQQQANAQQRAANQQQQNANHQQQQANQQQQNQQSDNRRRAMTDEERDLFNRAKALNPKLREDGDEGKRLRGELIGRIKNPAEFAIVKAEIERAEATRVKKPQPTPPPPPVKNDETAPPAAAQPAKADVEVNVNNTPAKDEEPQTQVVPVRPASSGDEKADK